MERTCDQKCRGFPLTKEAQEQWIESQVGECLVTVGKLNAPVFGYEDLVAQVELETAKMYTQILLGPEFTLEDANEIAQMLGRVLRSYYVRTRLMPLLEDDGGSVH